MDSPKQVQTSFVLVENFFLEQIDARAGERLMNSKKMNEVEVEKIIQCYVTNLTNVESQIKPIQYIVKTVRENNNSKEGQKYARSLRKTLEAIADVFQALIELPNGDKLPKLDEFFYARM